MRLWSEGGLCGGGVLLIAAAAYLIAQLLIRLAAPQAVELDEAEQLLLSQWLQGGYSPQPPLYTWLQILVNRALGPSVLALALLRTLLLLALFALVYLGARRALCDERRAALAALSFLFIVQVVWELQRENTHSLLVLTVAAAQFLSLLHLLERPSLTAYLLAGGLAGLGLLAKYNYAVFLAAVALALLTRPAGRALLADRRILAAGTLALLVLLPHLGWLWQQSGDLGGALAGKLDARSETGPLLAVGRLLLTLGSYLTPLWVLYLALFPRGYRRLLRGQPVIATSFPLSAYFGVLLAILLVLVLVLDADRFRERWMHPLLFLFPLWFFAHVSAEELTPARERWFRGLAAALALAMLAVMGFRSLVAPLTGPYARIHQPLAAVAAAMRATGLPTEQILAHHYHLAGSLRLHFPASRLYAPRADLVIPAPGEGPVLLAWDAARSETVPHDLFAYLAEHREALPSPVALRPTYVEVPYRGAPGGVYRLGLAAVP